MKAHQVIFVVVACVLLLLVLECKNAGSQSQPPSRSGCYGMSKTQHYESFYMKMALCRPNITVICISRPIHPCYKNITNFKATAFVQGHQGQCLIEANVTEERTLQFYIEAKRIHNPNQEGSRSIAGGSGVERHQKGKCLLRYVCHHRALASISMDCGTVFVSKNGDFYNFTKQRKSWKAPPNFKDFVYFTSKIAVDDDRREVDISSTRIYASGDEHNEGSDPTMGEGEGKVSSEKESQPEPAKKPSPPSPPSVLRLATKTLGRMIFKGISIESQSLESEGRNTRKDDMTRQEEEV